jgi:hypothetical protein
MATVTGLTAARMLEIESASVVDGVVVGDNLVLTKHDGSQVVAGNLRGLPGTPADETAIRAYADSQDDAFFDTTQTYVQSQDVANLTAAKAYTDAQLIKKTQSGLVDITPVTNVATSKVVTFPTAFATIPNVVIVPNSSVIGTTVQGASVTGVTTQGFTAWIYRANTTITSCMWIAHG